MTKKLAVLVTALAFVLATYPAVAQQEGKVYRIGVFFTSSERVQGVFVEPLRSGLRDAGYVEGRNIVLDVRFGNANRRRIAEQAAELVRRKVDIIVGFGLGAVRAVTKETKTIPVVSAFSPDLVGSGLATSLAKPGGNVTGMSSRASDLVTKWLQLTKETIPEASRVAVLFNPIQRTTKNVQVMKSAAAKIGITIQEAPVRAPGDFEEAFAAMARQRADALIMIPGRVTGGNRRQLIALANRKKIPAICWRPAMVRLGCLMSYGANRAQMVRRSASFVARILQGAKAADLPIEQPARFELVLNMETAKALDITFPPTILLQATKVID
jgi:putative ABC transport system substrate-binding protein